jgi:hypothetical protein
VVPSQTHHLVDILGSPCLPECIDIARQADSVLARLAARYKVGRNRTWEDQHPGRPRAVQPSGPRPKLTAILVDIVRQQPRRPRVERPDRALGLPDVHMDQIRSASERSITPGDAQQPSIPGAVPTEISESGQTIAARHAQESAGAVTTSGDGRLAEESGRAAAECVVAQREVVEEPQVGQVKVEETVLVYRVSEPSATPPRRS